MSQAATRAAAAAKHKKKKHSEELGDFTTTVEVIPISVMAIIIGFIATFVAWFLLKLIGVYKPLLLPPHRHRAFVTSRQPSRRIRHSCSSDWLPDSGAHGALRIGTHPRPWYSGSN